MARHPLGRRRLAAAAALAVLGLLLTFLGQASASHLNVEADGNLVWSSAWPDSPPSPPEPGAAHLPWAQWFVGASKNSLFESAETIGAVLPTAGGAADVTGYYLAFVGDVTTVIVPGEDRIKNRWNHIEVGLNATDIKAFCMGNALEPDTAYDFVMEVRRSDGTVVARTTPFWWGWMHTTQPLGFGAHASVVEPTVGGLGPD